jgi:hypothetical protein
MDILFFILLVMLFLLFVSNSSLKGRVTILEQRLDGLEGGVRIERAPAEAEPELVAEPEMLREAEAAAMQAPGTVSPAIAAPAPVEGDPEAPVYHEPHETLGGLFERWVAGRLLIWLGGIALVLAAIFLIRYSIEVGLITPAARMIGAGLFGLFLLAAGEWARRGRLADDPRIAQALVGAGIAVLYATVYGSHVLYALIGSRTAFAGMAAVTAAALGLSLRHGVPTAVLGLVGGFLTPLLVGERTATAAPLLTYLGLLDLALFALAWRRGWTWLAAAATALSFCWTLYLISQPGTQDPLLAGGFVVALSVIAATLRPGGGREFRYLQPLLLGLLQLGILVGRTDLGAPAFLLFGALALASLILGALRDEYRPAPLAALGLALVLLWWRGFWGPVDFLPAAAAGATLLFGGGGLALLWRAPGPLWSTLASFGAAGPLLVMRVMQPEQLTRTQWGGLAAALALAPALAVWLQRRRARAEAPAELGLLAAAAGFALLAGAAVWDLAAPDWIAAGWLGIALALAFAARRLDDLALGTAAVLVILCGVARALWMLPELSFLTFDGLLGRPVLASILPDATRALSALAVPAALLAAIRFVLPPLPMRARRALPILAGIFAVTALYLWFKQGFGLADEADFVRRGLGERTIITQALFAAGWLLGSGRLRLPRLAPDGVRLAGTWLTAAAAARLLWFDILLFNPAFVVEQNVGAMPVLNLISAEYLLGAGWLYLARRRDSGRASSWAWFTAFLLALTAGTALFVRQLYHGAILFPPDATVPNEAYGYSLAFLLVSIALIVAGVRLADKALRLAGLVLLTGTVVKVFLVDAAALTGLLRILSFLGLGVALIGIGRLYGPILRAEREDLADTGASR